MKKFKNSIIMITTICICAIIFSTTSFALEGDYSYYGYDESGGIYDFPLMEENAQIFEGITGVRPYILVTPYLEDNITAREYAKDFYNDENNFSDIFAYANYFIIIISDEEEVMDIFVNPNATDILTDDIVSELLNTYSNNIDNTKYYDVTIFDLLTQAEESILYNRSTLFLPNKNNVDTPITENTQVENNIKETVKQSNEQTYTEEENSSIFKDFIIFAIIFGVIGTIITKITLSFIHKRKKSEEDFELELERLNHLPSTDSILSSEPITSSYDDDCDNDDYDNNSDDYEDNSSNDDDNHYKDNTTSNTYKDSSTTINNITQVYNNTTPPGTINLGAVPLPSIQHRRVINTGIPSHQSEPKMPMYNAPSRFNNNLPQRMKPPTVPPTRTNAQMRKPSTPTTRSISHTPMRKPSTPVRRNKPSTMRRPSTPPRRSR